MPGTFHHIFNQALGRLSECNRMANVFVVVSTLNKEKPDKIGQSAHRSAINEVRDKFKIFTDFG